MASTLRSSPIPLILFLQLCFSFLSTTLAISSGSSDGYTINGRVKIESTGVKGFGLPGKTSNVKVILNGGQWVTFLRPDGYFSLYNIKFQIELVYLVLLCVAVSIGWRFGDGFSMMERLSLGGPANIDVGTHMIEVAAIGYFFSPVRVDVSARNPGKIQAALTENRKGLTELVLEPLREEQYYEIREPFSIMSVVKSPMGLMMGFMLIVMFLMPKLVETWVDLAYGDWQAHSLTRAFISLAQVVH
ncbi:ER membrane protein complex subunit 7-like [Vitis vinifera]|uniref:ER membrane protein complex subunit 7-like n=1 Tax=Vitis vinifera TaxID=29760 RepID=A0A438KEG6_VITVI|nr:ER membrane protein complex subunit 7-like [Vitis vinifera]